MTTDAGAEIMIGHTGTVSTSSVVDSRILYVGTNRSFGHGVEAWR